MSWLAVFIVSAALDVARGVYPKEDEKQEENTKKEGTA